MALAIEAKRLVKRFGDQVALDELSFTVAAGTALCILGPNGSGKTTAVKAVTGLYGLDSGRARILGKSVTGDADAVKHLTGFSGQFAAVDEDLTTLENLVLVGRLYGHSKPVARRKADDLVQAFDMGSYARKLVGQHSGGMRRRVDLACALVGDPRVLVLDEPTTGLDPASRRSLWAMISTLVRDGMSLLLTTQYLEEADVLADRVLVIAGGREIAAGTPTELKTILGGDRVEVDLAAPERDARAALDSVRALLPDTEPVFDEDRRRLSFRVPEATRQIAPCVTALTAAGVAIDGISVQQSTLDDVFFALTGHDSESADTRDINDANTATGVDA